MITIDIKGIKMKLHYETEDLAYARSFLVEIANNANFTGLSIEVKTTNTQESQS